MVPSKYYVYGGGRWRELDTVTGRVSGWRGARLCVARRGRLATQHGAKRHRVLAALRALAGHPGPGAADTAAELTARDGPRLPSKLASTHKSPRSTRCRCRCCCHNNNNNKDDNRCGGKSPASAGEARVQQPLTSDACVQVAPPGPARLAFPTSAGRHLTTVATVHNTPMETRNTSTPIGSSKKRNSSSTSWKHESSSGSTESPVNNTNASPKKQANLSLKRKRSNSVSSGTSKDEISISQSILKKDFNAKYSRVREADDRPPPRIRTRLIQRDVIDVSSDDENIKPFVSLTSTGRETEDTKTEEVVTKGREKGQMIQDKMDIYRELVISEDDVDILRRFMIKNNPKFNLYKYDNDDMYKAKFFYSINPLVSIEPCPRILEMLEGQDGLSLQQFASQLGLRSVSDEASSSDRAPPRKRRRPPPSREDTDTPDSEDKENLETTVGQSNRHNNTKEKDKHNTEDRKKLTDVTITLKRMKDDDGQRRRRNRGRSPERNTQGENMHRENLKRSRDDIHLKDERRKRQKQQETEAEGMKLVPKGNHSDKQKVISEKKAPVIQGGEYRSKEYSSIEDHAIVRWISSGDRAKLVNGNRVWRLLEQSFEEIGGRARSWHSLRNRYLRHLLPRLGLLELPVTQQARLRAAAAQGELKGKKLPQKRNSIYGEPVRGASSRDLRRSPRQPAPARAPAAAPAPARSPAAAPARSPAAAPARARAVTPRYSDVTRQFAARHPVSSSSEFEAESPARTRSRAFDLQPLGPGPLTRASNLQPLVPGPMTRASNLQPLGPGPLTRASNLQPLGPGPLTRASNLQPLGPGPLIRKSNPQITSPNPGPRTRKLYNPNNL